MVRKYIKKLSCMLLLASLVLCMNVTAFAAIISEIDREAKGSVSVTLQQSGTHDPVPGVTFALYHVGSIDNPENGQGLVYNKNFEDNGMLPDDLRAEGLAEHLANYASDQGIRSDRCKTDKNGQVVWKNLEPGLYLVVQQDRAAGDYAVNPFLITVPIENEDGTGWLYDVDASPKVEAVPDKPSEKELTVKKVWVDSGKNTPDSIEVKLFRDNKEYDSCVLDQSNSWTKTWSGLSEAYKWTVGESKVPAGYKVSYSSSESSVTITNTSLTEKPPKPPLIQTGQMNWPIPVLAGTGILIFVLGWYMTFIRRKK